jgi:hypothetical protein
MLANTKITLSVALVLTTVSTAFAAPKQVPVRHQPTIEGQVPASAYLSFGAVRSTGSVTAPNRQSPGDYTFVGPDHRFARTPSGNIIPCWGGSCSPDWHVDE